MTGRQLVGGVHIRTVGEVRALDLAWRVLPEVGPGALVSDRRRDNPGPVVTAE